MLIIAKVEGIGVREETQPRSEVGPSVVFTEVSLTVTQFSICGEAAAEDKTWVLLESCKDMACGWVSSFTWEQVVEFHVNWSLIFKQSG